MSANDLNSWGWRVPFLAGFLLMPIGYYLRTRVDETPAFQRLLDNRKTAKTPLRECFGHQKGAMFRIFCICAIWAAMAYVLFIYLPSFAAQVLRVDLKVALSATTIGSIVTLFVYPVVGLLSDRIGRKPIVQAANVIALLAMYPLFRWMETAPGFTSLAGTMVVAGILIATLGGAGPAILTELVSTRVRSTSVGIGYNMAIVIFGGFSPLICAYLVRQSGEATAPAFVLIACSLISIFGVMGLRDRASIPLDEL